MNMNLSSSSKGQVAQLEVELCAYRKGYFTSRPQTDLEYDLVIDTHKELIRAQIKFCNRKRHNNDNLELNLYNKNSNRLYYSNKNVDIILVYVPEVDKVLAYNSDKFHKRKTISINLTDKSSSFYYERYIW